MLEERIAAASGECEADLLLKNARLVNVLSGEIYEADVAVAQGRVLGEGDYAARATIDLAGRYLCPGFIDGHVHIESSMVTPGQFARAVVPAGTTSVVADPHEIANVLGLDGIRYMLAGSQGLPLNVFLMLPSCVPATPMETAGASLPAAALATLRDEPGVLGLGEMMNYPGVLHRVPAVLDMLRMIGDRPVDGHAPGLTGKALNAYVAAGIGSDHECTTAQEAREKLRAGMHVLIREGSTARNLRALLPAVSLASSVNCSFCTDDRHPADLLEEGHINDLVRKAIAAGLSPITAIQMATINTARHYRLWDLGAVAPGYRADLLALDDLEGVVVSHVFKDGQLVAHGGSLSGGVTMPPDRPLPSTFDVDWDAASAKIMAPIQLPSDAAEMRVIGVIPEQVTTQSLRLRPTVEAGCVVTDVGRDLLKMAVIERHKGTGNVGIGFVTGFGLRRGAIASSVAHDSHNIVTVGASDEELLLAARSVADMDGGQVAVAGDKVIARLPLPIAGLMSDHPLEDVRRGVDELIEASRSLGCVLPDPLMAMSFLALAVIPSLKLTDRGLVDVERFEIVPLWV